MKIINQVLVPFMFSLFLILMAANVFADGLPSPDEVTVNVLGNSNNPGSDLTKKPAKNEPGIRVKKLNENEVAIDVLGEADNRKSDESIANAKPGYGFGDKNHSHTGPPGLNKK